MKKKILAFFLAAAAAVGLCGCSGEEKKDFEAIKAKGEMVVGITYFEPMNYFDEAGKLTGFETEFTTAVCEKLGVKPKFQEIDWNKKVIELNSHTIDVIWNGMTVTEELGKEIGFSKPYIRNKQVVVIKKSNADKYKDVASMAGASIAAENGSAGQTAIENDAVLSKNKFLSCGAQKDVLMEIKAGTTEIGVIDQIMAVATIRDDNDYADLMIVDGIELTNEEYAVGIRKDDVELQNKINAAIDEMVKDGSLKSLCEKYGMGEQYAF